MENRIVRFLKYAWAPALIALIIFYLTCLKTNDEFPDVKIPYIDKLVHFCMFFGLSLIASLSYIFVNDGKIIILKLLIFAIVLPIIYGGLIEILQANYFERSGDWFDFAADAAGSLTSIPISLWFRRILLKQDSNNI